MIELVPEKEKASELMCGFVFTFGGYLPARMVPGSRP